MYVYYYTFRTMTAAMTAAGKLKSRGINLRPIRSPEPLRKRGCGFCIRVSEEQFSPSVQESLRGLYEKRYSYGNGEWRELSL